MPKLHPAPAKSVIFLLCMLTALAAQLRAAETGWHAGRIVSVDKDVNTKTLYWLVNTPVTQDEITYRIVVHVGRTLINGSYEPGKAQGDPPKEWVKDFPVNLKVVGSDLYLLAIDNEQYKLHIDKRKSAPPVKPVTKEELAAVPPTPATVEDRPIGIGSAPAAPEKAAEPAAAPEPAPEPNVTAPAPSAEPAGVISVRTTPYLAEVYVDGNDMGYTPAKLSLRPGKHTIRFEKHGYKEWTKEITVTAGSEQLVDATLEGK